MAKDKARVSVIKESLNKLYTDTITVYSQEPKTDPITKRITNDREVIDNMKDLECRVSFGSSDSGNNDNKAINPMDYDVLVFMDSSHKIKKGSYVIIKRMADDGTVLDTIKGLTGNAAIYPSHQQLPVNDSERA